MKIKLENEVNIKLIEAMKYENDICKKESFKLESSLKELK